MSLLGETLEQLPADSHGNDGTGDRHGSSDGRGEFGSDRGSRRREIEDGYGQSVDSGKSDSEESDHYGKEAIFHFVFSSSGNGLLVFLQWPPYYEKKLFTLR